MSNVKTLKGISFRATFSGTGCVNFDSNEQKYELMRMGIIKGTMNDNVSFSKKVYYLNPDGTYSYKTKVSADALRHAIFIKEQRFQNPTIQQIPETFYAALGNPALITRGYLFPGEDITLKRKSPLTITDAIEIGDKWSVIPDETKSRSGAKGANEDGKSDTSFYKKNNIGEKEYIANGYIDMQEMQFLSADPSYDRMGVDVDGGAKETIYLDALNRNLPTQGKKFGYYYMSNSITQDAWAERGILLSKDDVDFLVKYILKKILDIAIHRATGEFEIKKLEVSFDNKRTYQELTLNNLDDFYFDVIPDYKEASEEKIIANRKIMEELIVKKKADKKSSKKSAQVKEEE